MEHSVSAAGAPKPQLEMLQKLVIPYMVTRWYKPGVGLFKHVLNNIKSYDDKFQPQATLGSPATPLYLDIASSFDYVVTESLNYDAATITEVQYDTSSKNLLVLKNMPKACSTPSSLPILFINFGINSLQQCSLQYAFNIQSVHIEQCEITQHCLQLVAMQSNSIDVFWNIPKCGVKLTCTNSLKCKEDLCLAGIVETTVHPKQLVFSGEVFVSKLLIKQEENHKSVDVILKNVDEEIKMLPYVPNESIHRERWAQEATQENTKKSVQDRLNLEADKKAFPGDEVYLQYQHDLRTSKLEAKINKANEQINYLQSKLRKSEQLVHQFQEAAEKAKEKDKPMEEEHEKVKDSFEQDTTAKVIKVLQDKLSYKFGKEFKQAFPEYKVAVETHEEIPTVQQLEDKLDYFMEDVIMFFDLKQQETQSQYQQYLKEANEKNILQNRSIKQLETAQKAKEKIEDNVLRKLEDCNLELEKKFKQIIFDYETTQDEGYKGEDTTLQLDYNLDYLKRLIKQFDKVQSECNKQKQFEISVQHQDQIDDLESALKICKMKLKKSEDDNKQLSKRRQEWSKREMELQDQINTLQSKLEMNTMMLKKLEDDNELLSKELRETSQPEDQVINSAKAEKSDDKMEADMPLHQSDAAVAPASLQPGDHEMETDKPMYQNDVPTATMDAMTPAEAPKHIGSCGMWNENEIKECAKSNGSVMLSLIFSPVMYQHFIQSHGLQIDRKAVFIDTLALNNLITNPATINCIIPVCLEELNKFILDMPGLEFLQSLVYKHRGKHKVDKPLIDGQTQPVSNSSTSSAVVTNPEHTSAAFIVYQNDGNLCDQVDNFSDILRTYSIDCDVASYYLHKDIANWNVCIQQCVECTEYILLVCTKELLERLNGQSHERIKMTRSSGPYILSTALQCLLETKSKILPIIFDEQSKKYIPAYLQSKTNYTISFESLPDAASITKQDAEKILDMPEQKDFKSLVAKLLGQQEVIKPPVASEPPIFKDSPSLDTPLGRTSLQATVSSNKIGEAKKKKLIYVVHRSDGKQWVTEILGPILIELNTVMTTPNDFISGLTLGESHYEAVSKAHYTVIVFTKLTVEDKKSDEQKWFNFALSKAEHKNPDPSVITIIPVLHGDIPLTSLPATVKDIVPLKTDDPQFKSKIQQSITYNDKRSK